MLRSPSTKNRNYYWVLQNKFLAGEYPRNLDESSSQEKLGSLIKTADVSAFIDLTEENEGLEPYSHFLDKFDGVSHQRFPIRDMSIPATKELASGILDAIDEHIQNQRIVYLHCWGGIGRTGVVVGCWLARHGCHGKSALVRLQELWLQCPKSAYCSTPQTIEQIQYIVNWEETR
jgi:protein-tyrosine phosphatase